MQEEKTVHALIINSTGFFLTLLGFLIFGTLVTIICTFRFSFHYHYIVPFGGLILFWILLPLIFLKRVKKSFSRKVAVRFYEDHISVDIFNGLNGDLEKTDDTYFNTLKAIRIFNSAKDDSSRLSLYFKTSEEKRYAFWEQNAEDGEAGITDLVADRIIAYNANQDEAGRIQYMPGLFASKKGTLYIILLSLLLLVIFALQVISKATAIPFTFFAGIILYLQIIMQRKRDKKDMEKFNGA
ncbi:MAG: hypothetical protein Q8918_08125 [Bacteroidota bacterium]|nr:hypothetical protein [Bacteroidota bacterium]MDP4250064.1 hypothetical protein [Bacteroidota bacterium]